MNGVCQRSLLTIKQLERRIRHDFIWLTRSRETRRKERAALALFQDPRSRGIFEERLRIHYLGNSPIEYMRRLAPFREPCALPLCREFCRPDLGGSEPPISMDEHQYFPRDLIHLAPDEVFLDAGAFVGDTLHSILAHTHGRFGAIHSFEPDRQSYAKLCGWVAALPPEQRSRIHCYRKALAMEARKVPFTATGSVSGNIFQTEGDELVDVVNIHDVLAQDVLDRLSFVKMDVEGAEMEVLRSLEPEIRVHHPILAVCVYHKQEDLIEIPAYVHDLHPAYHLFLRHHSNCRCETVLYAIPPGRLISDPGRS